MKRTTLVLAALSIPFLSIGAATAPVEIRPAADFLAFEQETVHISPPDECTWVLHIDTSYTEPNLTVHSHRHAVTRITSGGSLAGWFVEDRIFNETHASRGLSVSGACSLEERDDNPGAGTRPVPEPWISGAAMPDPYEGPEILSETIFTLTGIPPKDSGQIPRFDPISCTSDGHALSKGERPDVIFGPFESSDFAAACFSGVGLTGTIGYTAIQNTLGDTAVSDEDLVDFGISFPNLSTPFGLGLNLPDFATITVGISIYDEDVTDIDTISTSANGAANFNMNLTFDNIGQYAVDVDKTNGERVKALANFSNNTTCTIHGSCGEEEKPSIVVKIDKGTMTVTCTSPCSVNRGASFIGTRTFTAPEPSSGLSGNLVFKAGHRVKWTGKP